MTGISVSARRLLGLTVASLHALGLSDQIKSLRVLLLTSLHDLSGESDKVSTPPSSEFPFPTVAPTPTPPRTKHKLVVEGKKLTFRCGKKIASKKGKV